jgi:hypothetical protein
LSLSKSSPLRAGTDRGGLVCNRSFDKVVVTLREQVQHPAPGASVRTSRPTAPPPPAPLPVPSMHPPAVTHTTPTGAQYDMDKLVAKHLMQNYGTRALLVADIAKQARSAPPVCTPTARPSLHCPSHTVRLRSAAAPRAHARRVGAGQLSVGPNKDEQGQTTRYLKLWVSLDRGY